MNSGEIIRYSKPTSCLLFFLFFPLLYHLPCASSQQELVSCEIQFECGIITAGFPFWGANRPEHCGHPLLKLHCNKNSITTLIISDQEYYVLDLDQASYALRIVRADLLEIFEILPTYMNLTIFYRCSPDFSYLSNYTCASKGIVSVGQKSRNWYLCNESFTVTVPQSVFLEEKEFALKQIESVLREGFEVKVKIDEITCQNCSSSGGICAFNSTTQVCCTTTSPSGGVSCVPKRQPSAEELHSRCGTPFHCGNQSNLLYPFWIPGRKECGHPDFKLSCIGGFAEVRIDDIAGTELFHNSHLFHNSPLVPQQPSVVGDIAGTELLQNLSQHSISSTA